MNAFKFFIFPLLLSCFSLSQAQLTTQTLLKGASGIAEARKNTSPHYYADKWFRNSAERIAIYREVFYMGENIIRARVKEKHLKPHQWGVIIDIDETALDNSVWNYQQDIAGMNQNRNDFMKEARSVATPGIVKLTHEIHKMGGYVNFVSNRPATLLAATKKNLLAQGIYFDQLLLDTSNQGTPLVNKNYRFNAITAGKPPSHLPRQKIIAWFGSDIQDFPGLKQSDMMTQDPNGPAYDQFGVTFFLVPNPMYGSWEINKFN